MSDTMTLFEHASQSTGDAVAPVVRVRGLNKTFVREGGETVRAIDDVSFDVSPGEFTVLLGPSGCGKTTLLRAIAGLETPDSGSVELQDRTVFSSQDAINVPPEKRRISMVFQSYALWPHMTAFDNIAYPLRAQRGSRPPKTEITDRVNHVLGLVGIPDLGGQYPSQMSGGQQQRVALARALVVGTDLVLFDEPLSNVDAKVREQLRLELLTMQESLGFAALFVTHDQTEAMVLADRIAVLDRGTVAQFGTPTEIYAEPESRYVANFIGTTNEVGGTISSVQEDDSCVVQTAVGRIVGIPGTDAVREGGSVVAVWRPERLAIYEDRPDTNNRWRGVIQAVLFLGSHVEIVVAAQDHLFRVWSARLDAGYTPDEEVWLSVPNDSVRVLPAGSA